MNRYWIDLNEFRIYHFHSDKTFCIEILDKIKIVQVKIGKEVVDKSLLPFSAERKVPRVKSLLCLFYRSSGTKPHRCCLSRCLNKQMPRHADIICDI